MEIDRLLILDCRKEENRQMVQKELKKQKAFAKYKDDIPAQKIEEFIHHITNKYTITIQYMNYISYGKEGTYWSCPIKRTTNHEWIKTIYGYNTYDALTKAALYMYSEIKKGNIDKNADN